MWRVYRAAGRPWPVLSDDPVIDYMVMEAVAMKAQKEQRKAEKDAEEEAKRKEFKRNKAQELKELVG